MVGVVVVEEARGVIRTDEESFTPPVAVVVAVPPVVVDELRLGLDGTT